jgi:hypothetical protein
MERSEKAPTSRAREVLEGALGLAVLVAIGAAIWSHFGGSPETATAKGNATPAAQRAPGHHTIRELTFGCTSPEAFRDAADYWGNHDSELFQGMFASGACQSLKPGEKVVLVDVKLMDYAVVRRPGDPTKLVTFTSVLD